MKTNVILIILLVVTISCKKENNIAGIISGEVVTHSDCKNSKSATYDVSLNNSSESCIQYLYSENEEKLILSYINAGFNCCPDSLFCNVELSGDTILISEFEKSALCDCNCLYDLKIEVAGIKKDKYYVKVIEPYCGGQEKLNFKIDLVQNASGTYCVERKLYPWGM